MPTNIDDFRREVKSFIEERIIMLIRAADRIADAARSLKRLLVCARSTIMESKVSGCSDSNIDPCVDSVVYKFSGCYEEAKRALEYIIQLKYGEGKRYLDYYYGGPAAKIDIDIYLGAAYKDIDTVIVLGDFITSLALAYIGAATEYDYYIIFHSLDNVVDILGSQNISVNVKDRVKMVSGREKKIFVLAEYFFRYNIMRSVLLIIANNAGNAADTISLLAVKLRQKADELMEGK